MLEKWFSLVLLSRYIHVLGVVKSIVIFYMVINPEYLIVVKCWIEFVKSFTHWDILESSSDDKKKLQTKIWYLE